MGFEAPPFGGGRRLVVAHARKTLAGLLRQPPGCWFCREEAEAEAHYFFWFINEQSGMPEGLEPLRRSQGFCRRHTALFLKQAGRDVVASVYGVLLRDAQQAVAAATHPVPTNTAPCPACAARDRRREGLVRAIAPALATGATEAVGAALPDARAVCLWHLRETAAQWPWSALRAMVSTVLANIVGDARSGGGGEGWLAADLPPAEVTPPPPLVGDALKVLLARLARGVCVLCQLQQEAMVGYLEWLQEEVAAKPPSHWDQSLRICRSHLTAWRAVASEEAWARWVAALGERWQRLLAPLAERLSHPPPRWRWQRLVAGVRAGPAHGWRVRLRQAWPGRAERLREWVAVTFEAEAFCPVCRVQAEAVRSGAEWLAWGIATAAGARRYAAGGCVCLRHWPALLQAAPDRRPWLAQVHATQYRRLQWLLDEYLRKSDWNHRWEPRSFEQGAFLEAVRGYAGVVAD